MSGYSEAFSNRRNDAAFALSGLANSTLEPSNIVRFATMAGMYLSDKYGPQCLRPDQYVLWAVFLTMTRSLILKS
jgi:hypothetical protein